MISPKQELKKASESSACGHLSSVCDRHIVVFFVVVSGSFKKIAFLLRFSITVLRTKHVLNYYHQTNNHNLF